MKTEWNFKLLYENAEDPQIQKDVDSYAEACISFEKKYRGKSAHFENVDTLFSALTDYENLLNTIRSAKPIIYFDLQSSVKSNDSNIQARLNSLRQLYDKEANRVIFFELDLGKLSEKKQKEFLESPRLSHFNYFLKLIFENAKHDLSEAEEKIMNLKALTSYSLWTEGLEKALGKLRVPHRSKKIGIAEAANLIPNLPRSERLRLHGEMNKALGTIRDFAESEMNAIILNKKINDNLRKFSRPYSSVFLSNENSEAEVMTLLRAIENNVAIAHRFYEIKRKILKVPHLKWPDAHAAIGTQKKTISFEQGCKILQGVFASIHPSYGKILDKFIESGQVDVFPRPHKRGGAFCAGFLNLPTFVLLNWVDNFDSANTFAHEMGHAIHSELVREQSPIYQGYTTSVAEVASTLFENFLFYKIFDSLSTKEKIIALHDKIVDDLMSTFRQLAAFKFELRMHETIREEGYLSEERIRKLLIEEFQKISGKSVKYEEEDGLFFIRWGHLRSFFYNYQYAYGRLISRGLYTKWKNDTAYLTKIESFMRAGSSKSPQEIFRDIGIDTSSQAFWQEGIDAIKNDIDLLSDLLSLKQAKK